MPVIAIDLGATKSAAAVFNEQGAHFFSETILLENRKGKEIGFLLLQQINKLLKKASENNLAISAAGICVPGIAYSKSGNAWCPNIPGWEDYPLKHELQSGISDKKIEIKIDSDRACYILGETWKGNAQNCSNAIFLSVGTGIGAGILINNQILRGSQDIAGAIGWLGLEKPFHDKFISCGNFEYYASGEGLVRMAVEMIQTGKYEYSVLANNGLDILNAKMIFDAFEKSDPLAIKVIENAIGYWGMAVANLVSLFNPEKIIFGGGVFGPALKFLDAIYLEAKKWAQPISIQQVLLKGSGLGNNAGIYGAARLAMKD